MSILVKFERFMSNPKAMQDLISRKVPLLNWEARKATERRQSFLSLTFKTILKHQDSKRSQVSKMNSQCMQEVEGAIMKFHRLI